VKIDHYYQLKMGVMAQKYDQLDAKRHLILSIALGKVLLQGGSNAAKKALNKNHYSKIIVVFLKNKNQLPLLLRFLPLILPTYMFRLLNRARPNKCINA
jgi:hypothetical protein